ncbi:C1 family peptidase [Undibacterium sp. Ji50W]|uniref:C1 family peptidase n=1 Tax=Undibacterium sp. Ji50W TaxID=3413041 RepID=UPI003BF2C038
MPNFASTQTTYYFGWKPELPDIRDRTYSASFELINNLPPKIDLRDKCPQILNQDQLGSCTANAISSAHFFCQLRQKPEAAFQPSRLFIYYNERVIEGTQEIDHGAYIRDGFKTIAKDGVCPEVDWSYNIKRFNVQPDQVCYEKASNSQSIEYQRLTQSLSQLKACLAEGYPFVFGFTAYGNLISEEVRNTGHLTLPNSGEKSIGGHAVLAVGYDDSTQNFIAQNSWGADWGDKGYFYIPYSYVTDNKLADDIWTLRLVEV